MDLTYETKCRRCGEVTEWWFSEFRQREDWLKLYEYVFEHSAFPSPCKCKKCGKTTIQDYVAYTEQPTK